MSGMPVIHFLEFEDFLDEIETLRLQESYVPVRVQSHVTRRMRSMGQHHVPLVELCAQVTVGAIQGGQILSYCPYAQPISYVMEMTPQERREWEEKGAAGERLAEQIWALLEERGYVVRRGLIDMGDVQVVHGNPVKLGEAL